MRPQVLGLRVKWPCQWFLANLSMDSRYLSRVLFLCKTKVNKTVYWIYRPFVV